MGEYNKTYSRINDLKKRKKAKYKQIEKLEKWISRIREDISEINQEIGECEGYISELNYIDNGNGGDW